MKNTDFKKYMCYVLGILGVLSNIVGLVGAFVINANTTVTTITMIEFILISIVYIICILKKLYGFFITVSSVIIGAIMFPLILMNTDNPSIFILYLFMIPVAYGISVSSYKSFILPIITLIINAVCIYIKTDTATYCIAYIIIFIFNFGIVSFYALNNAKLAKADARKYRRMAERDELTSLYNRYYLQKVVDRNEKWIPIMVDIDNFKKVNDTFGHKTGDEALQGLALILLRYSSDSFMVFRYGGEEFLIISKLSEKGTINQSIEFFNAVRRELRANSSSLTVSVGIGEKGILTSDSIKIADNNLYLAKNSGRNCIAKGNTIIYK